MLCLALPITGGTALADVAYTVQRSFKTDTPGGDGGWTGAVVKEDITNGNRFLHFAPTGADGWRGTYNLSLNNTKKYFLSFDLRFNPNAETAGTNIQIEILGAIRVYWQRDTVIFNGSPAGTPNLLEAGFDTAKWYRMQFIIDNSASPTTVTCIAPLYDVRRTRP